MFRFAIYTLIVLLISSCSAKNHEEFPADKPKVKNIILLIGDGMGITQITAAMYSSDLPLNIERFKIVGLQKHTPKIA